MKPLNLVALSALIALGAPVQAEEQIQEMATRQGCFVCHTIQHKSGPAIPLAPPYEDIAELYKGRDDAAGYLAERIRKGTLDDKQNWEGKVNMRFMPPNVNVSEDEAQQLAEWILSVEKGAVTEEVVTYEGMLNLAAQNGCMACHGVNKQEDSHYIPLAPTFHEVAERYKNAEGAEATLVKVIQEGTSEQQRQWPDVNMRFMPSNPGINDEDAATLAQWILTL